MAARSGTCVAISVGVAVVVTLVLAPAAVAVSHPSAPRSVHAKPGNTTVRVSWVPPLSDGGAPVDGYRVQRADATAGPWTTVADLAATTFAWKNTGLTNGTTYYFRTRAHNVAGWGGGSRVVSAVPRTVPSAPQSPTASWGDASVTMSWSAPLSDGGSPVNAYRLQFSYDGTTWTNVPAGLQTQLTVSGLSNGDGIRVVIRAHNAAGWGPPSIETSVTPGVPQIPVNVQAQSSAGGIAISCSDWEPGITWFEVEMSFDGGVDWTWLPGYPSGPTDHGFSDTFTAGTPGQTYEFRVYADNRYGSSPASSIVSAVFGLAPGAVSNLTVTHYGSPLFANYVTWSAPTTGSPVQGYYVDRIVNAPPVQRIATDDPAHTSYYDTGATGKTYYWYRVTPYNALGSGPSRTVEITTP